MILLEGIFALEALILAIVLHEVGHIIAFKMIGIDVKLNLVRTATSYVFKVGSPEDYNINELDKKNIYFIGIVFGIFVLQAYMIWAPAGYLFILPMIIFYLYGCKNDIINLCGLER